jgi:hypothetical protein
MGGAILPERSPLLAKKEGGKAKALHGEGLYQLPSFLPSALVKLSLKNPPGMHSKKLDH